MKFIKGKIIQKLVNFQILSWNIGCAEEEMLLVMLDTAPWKPYNYRRYRSSAKAKVVDNLVTHSLDLIYLTMRLIIYILRPVRYPESLKWDSDHSQTQKEERKMRFIKYMIGHPYPIDARPGQYTTVIANISSDSTSNACLIFWTSCGKLKCLIWE